MALDKLARLMSAGLLQHNAVARSGPFARVACVLMNCVLRLTAPKEIGTSQISTQMSNSWTLLSAGSQPLSGGAWQLQHVCQHR